MLHIVRVLNRLHKGFISVPVLGTDPWGRGLEGGAMVEVTPRKGTDASLSQSKPRSGLLSQADGAMECSWSECPDWTQMPQMSIDQWWVICVEIPHIQNRHSLKVPAFRKPVFSNKMTFTLKTAETTKNHWERGNSLCEKRIVWVQSC